ncbi:hypothetical protein ABZY44_29415 [Streptomyces sp. NPDC006544]|uniref:hypothetical protein n=1 Tax=Streptomyces sp. NPDC006544 TaxID=3154583 RepID=UPI0033A7248C
MNEKNRTMRPAWVDVHLGHSRPRPYERDAALLAGVPPTRRALFAHGLTGPGLAALWSLLESGRYELHAPQEAALLCVAWLLRSGDLDDAAELAVLLDPFADLQPFTPRPGATRHPGGHAAADTCAADAADSTETADSGIKRSAREAARLLARQRQNPAVAAQREALTVWRPFEDELLAYWLRAHARAAHAPRAEAAALLERYEALAAAHPLTGRHLDPKSNAAILRRALAERAAGRELPLPLAGLLRHAVTSMVAKRGRPGSPAHTRLRQEQVRQAAVLRGPFAPVLDPVWVPHPAGPADATGPDTATPRADVLVALAAAEEARAPWEAGLSGVRLPHSAGAALARAYHPQVTDPVLRILLAKLYQGGARYCAHLWDFAGLAELPWIRAVAGPPSPDPEALGIALRQLATVTTEASCGSVTDPSLPLVRGLSALAHEAGIPASFAAEPFADRDTGVVSEDVLPAVRVAADLLRGTPYERYHGIDYAAVRALADADDRRGFAVLCVVRAGRTQPGSRFTRHVNSLELAAVPAVIEQVRILTAFNMPALVHQIGVVPGPDGAALARSAFTAARRRAATPARTARAFRHLLFHLSFCAPDQQASVLDWIDSETARLPRGTAGRLAPLVARLRTAMAGGAVGG